MARLLNAIAATKRGRDYLATYNVVPLLFWGEPLLGIRTEKPRAMIAQTTADNLMAASFKMSLVFKQRIEMVHRNVTQWTIHHLIDIEQSPLLTEYHLRSTTSLLLVMLTHKPYLREGVCECLTLLERYLSCNCPSIRGNVSKCLLVLMENSNIRTIAKLIGLPEAIAGRMKVSGVEYDELSALGSCG